MNSKCLLASIPSALIAGSQCPADTYVVSPKFPGSIQALIDFVVADGDVIQLEQGTYLLEAPIDPRGLEITIRGADPGTDGTVPTILDGQGQTRVIHCDSQEGPETRFEYLSIQNAASGGFWCQGSPTISRCVFRHNENSGEGGGLTLYGHSHVVDCLFEHNRAGSGGGLYVAGGATATIERCTIRRNETNSGSPSSIGGAILSGGVALVDSKLCENQGHQISDFWIDGGGNEITDLCGCIGDVNFDNAVNGTDLGVIFALWGSANQIGDLNDDGDVGAPDLGILLASWGACP